MRDKTAQTVGWAASLPTLQTKRDKTMSLKYCFVLILSAFFIAFGCFPTRAIHAQISTDGTLGAAASLTGPNFRIGADLGKQTGGNLFHSFKDFNINTRESAAFTGPNSVQNIISRVTGGNVSQIDGLLRSEIPGANFFLLNPAGILFGQNASLDIGGSFHVSTADYLRLGEKGRFDVLSGENDLLTAEPPSAFGFLRENPSDIEIKGNLEVPEKQSLSIIGGNVNVSGGVLSAPGGQIRIFSAASAGEISLSPASESEFLSFEKLGDISFTDNATADVSADQAGEIYIRGGNFLLSGSDSPLFNSSVCSVTGESDGGIIDIRMREAIRLTEYGSIFTRTTGDGNSGNISLFADSLYLDTGRILTESGWTDDNGLILFIGKGNSGDISFNIREMRIRGGVISTNTLDTGNAGNISISADLLQIGEQGKIVADNGNVYVGEGGTATSGTVVGGKGNSGNITLDLNRLEMDRASISSNTVGAGAGGTVSVTARDAVNIDGSGEKEDPKLCDDCYYGIGCASEGSGKGGHINITTGELNLSKDGMISGQAHCSGVGGNVSLEVKRLNVSPAEP
jgi:filamentous hemagglutinin family protein